MTGKTGGVVLKTSHMMGVMVEGLPKTTYEDQAVFAVKGTASLMDLITDLNAGLKRSKTGGNVHQGFQDAFNSYFNDLPVVSGNVHTIHCVGHSLGGALATLTADWLKLNSGRLVKLYTFGSPRVGLDFFADGCETRIGKENVHRVSHETDPVPMVPTWPFVHVASSGQGDYLLPSNGQLRFWRPHFMESYIDSVKPEGSKKGLSWPELEALRPETLLDSTVEAWLRSDGPVSFTLNSAAMAGAALLWVVETLINLTGIAVVIAGGTMFTVLDRLAYLVHKAGTILKDAGFRIARILTMHSSVQYL